MTAMLQMKMKPAFGPTPAIAMQLQSLSMETREVIDLQNDTDLSNRRTLGFFAAALSVALAVALLLAISSGTASAMPVTQAMAAKTDGWIALTAVVSTLFVAGLGLAVILRHINLVVARP